MRIAVVSYPRTSSTLLAKSLASIHNLQYFGEVITSNKVSNFGTSLTDFINQENYVIKYMGFNFLDYTGYKISDINWNIYDDIYATCRVPVYDACISTKMAFITGQWEQYVNNNASAITVDDEFIDGFLRGVSKFNEIISHFNNHGIVYHKIDYAQITSEYTSMLPSMQPSNINYKEVCLNYGEVKQKFKELGYE
jgi:hypothetical protein